MISFAGYNGDRIAIAAIMRACNYSGLMVSDLLYIYYPITIFTAGGEAKSGSY
jgi:hypothetical protein